MPTIRIQRRHELDPKTAKAAAQEIVKDLHKRFDIECTWDADTVRFRRPGVTGEMRLGKSAVELTVELSFLMSPLKGPIEHAIRDELDRVFGAA